MWIVAIGMNAGWPRNVLAFSPRILIIGVRAVAPFFDNLKHVGRLAAKIAGKKKARKFALGNVNSRFFARTVTTMRLRLQSHGDGVPRRIGEFCTKMWDPSHARKTRPVRLLDLLEAMLNSEKESANQIRQLFVRRGWEKVGVAVGIGWVGSGPSQPPAEDASSCRKRRQRKKKTLGKPGSSEEAPGGFEPPMSDLQSDALATWPRRPRTLEN